MMEEYNRAKIKSIKSKVIGMLEERRQALQPEEIAVLSPSKYWADFCSYFDYMLELPEESFSKLRLHTYHLTGDNYQTYYLGDPQAFKAVVNLDALIKDIPPKFVLNEPEGGIGFSYSDGRFVSFDIVRYQKVVNTLYRHGVLSALSSTDKQRGNYVFEIGAGYGGLANHLSNILGNVTYVISDLPETLLFSASYLSLLNPLKNIYIYDSSDFSEFIGSSAVGTYDFILIPNYRLHSLRHLRFELVINVASFQEMRTEQVDVYLDFICETCMGVVYSWNQDSQPRNSELSNLSEMLSARFELMEVFQPEEIRKRTGKIKVKLSKALKSIATHVGLLNRPLRPLFPDEKYREFICRPLPRMSQDSKCKEGI